ncbi:MAG: KilA-N domain-containing protein, partial [Candidatus Azobacteroides sp.]|nr:KilA-N domain-containing protein [Candidatus Azobacteroides sp.]
AIGKIVPADFMKTAMKKIGEALNWVIFNEHESGIRNKFGDEQKQRELSQLERKVADLINEGFISDYKEMISYLRKLYQQKNYPKVFMQ